LYIIPRIETVNPVTLMISPRAALPGIAGSRISLAAQQRLTIPSRS